MRLSVIPRVSWLGSELPECHVSPNCPSPPDILSFPKESSFWPWVGGAVGRLRRGGLAWIAAIWHDPNPRYWLSVCTKCPADFTKPIHICLPPGIISLSFFPIGKVRVIVGEGCGAIYDHKWVQFVIMSPLLWQLFPILIVIKEKWMILSKYFKCLMCNLRPRVFLVSCNFLIVFNKTPPYVHLQSDTEITDISFQPNLMQEREWLFVLTFLCQYN